MNIESIYAIVAADTKGRETLFSLNMEGKMWQCVTSEKLMLAMMWAEAKKAAKIAGKTVRAIKFERFLDITHDLNW